MIEQDANWMFMVARTVVQAIYGDSKLNMLSDERVKAVLQSLLTVESS